MKIIQFMKQIGAPLALMVAVSATANAQELVDTHGAWRVLKTKQDGQSVCYLASLPVKETGNYTKRGEPYVLVKHLSKSLDEVSVSSGYPYKSGDDVKVSFGQKIFRLFTKGEIAWAYDEKTDKALVKEMVRGSKLVVSGKSWKGTTSKDTYSLKGFTAAHRQMKKECQ